MAVASMRSLGEGVLEGISRRIILRLRPSWGERRLI